MRVPIHSTQAIVAVELILRTVPDHNHIATAGESNVGAVVRVLRTVSDDCDVAAISVSTVASDV